MTPPNQARLGATMERVNAAENAGEPIMNSVIVYDTVDYAAKAKAMLERAAQRAGETTHCSVKPWRVDMLELPPAAEAALVEAAEAHLIMLAVRQVQSHLVDWLERWAACRQVREAALAVWHGEAAEPHCARATTEWSKFADRHGLILLGDDIVLAGDNFSKFASDLHKREVASTSTFPHILGQAARDHHRDWGINE